MLVVAHNRVIRRSGYAFLPFVKIKTINFLMRVANVLITDNPFQLAAGDWQLLTGNWRDF